MLPNKSIVLFKSDEVKKFDKSNDKLPRTEIANQMIEVWSSIDEDIIVEVFEKLNYLRSLFKDDSNRWKCYGNGGNSYTKICDWIEYKVILPEQ